MFFLFLFRCLSTYPTYFLGNYTAPIPNYTINEYNHNFIQIKFLPDEKISNGYNETCPLNVTSVAFVVTSKIYFKRNPIRLYGFQLNDTFYFFNFFSDIVTDSSYFANYVCKLSRQSNFTQETFHEIMHNKFPRFSTLTTLSFTLFPDTPPSRHIFYLPIGFNGSLKFHNSSTLLLVDGFKYNYLDFISKAKLFGVVSSFFVVIGFYGWKSIATVESLTVLQQLSVESYIMHMSFEFSWAMFIFEYGLRFIQIQSLYLVLTLTFMVVYFAFQMTLVSKIWRAMISDDIAEFDIAHFRNMLFSFLSKLTLITTISLFAFVYVFDHPLIPLFLLYSEFIPQIIKSAKENAHKTADTKFILSIAASRISFLIYFFLNRMNISSSYSIWSIFVLVYFLLQIVILLLQNKFGGSFFLPQKFHPQYFDYYSGVVEPNTECAICMLEIENGESTMLTPCKHAFHKDCLLRWMQEQMVCPICRTRLPPLEH